MKQHATKEEVLEYLEKYYEKVNLDDINFSDNCINEFEYGFIKKDKSDRKEDILIVPCKTYVNIYIHVVYEDEDYEDEWDFNVGQCYKNFYIIDDKLVTLSYIGKVEDVYLDLKEAVIYKMNHIDTDYRYDE